jgi:GATA-binding protein
LGGRRTRIMVQGPSCDWGPSGRDNPGWMIEGSLEMENGPCAVDLFSSKRRFASIQRPVPFHRLSIMDSLAFDGYASYSDSSAPRTPSPRDEIHYPVYKHLEPPVRNIFTDSHDDHAVPVNPTWSHHNHSPNYDYHPSRPSLLQELYEPELPDNHTQHHQPPYDSWAHSRPNDYHPIRRATYPIARHDQEHSMPLQYRSFWSQDASIVHAHYARQDSYYADSLPPLPSEQSQLPSEHIIPPMNTSPHAGYRNFDENANIKLEDPPAASMMVSSYRCMPSNCHTLGVSYLPTGHPVHHTDDAASKETQYLRRRCFNCHTTEPPSWRRSTLNPGKIVCNKCGLYERTHLRPRPLRFDELRAGNKTRKQSKGTTSPKPKTTVVKKEPREFNGLTRRDSVSSSSSVQSGSATSDWDDSGTFKSRQKNSKC